MGQEAPHLKGPPRQVVAEFERRLEEWAKAFWEALAAHFRLEVKRKKKK